MLAAVDEEVHAGFIQGQVKLLGGCKDFYELIDKSLSRTSIMPFFKEEQRSLLEWREEFFEEKFSWKSSREASLYWFTDGNDDAHGMDTMPYQITQNFDEGHEGKPL